MKPTSSDRIQFILDSLTKVHKQEMQIRITSSRYPYPYWITNPQKPDYELAFATMDVLIDDMASSLRDTITTRLDKLRKEVLELEEIQNKLNSEEFEARIS